MRQLGQAEIQDFDAGRRARGAHDVRRLDVAVDHARSMGSL
jgi:hypothetical protein